MATNNQDLRDANDLLREQLELLKQVNDLQQDSYDVSSSAVDSIKEALGINSRRSTFENSTLKVNKSIAQAILDQKTGLRDLESIGRQINKNQDLLNKAKIIENGLANNLGGADLSRIDRFLKIYKIQQSLNQQLEDGEKIDLAKINKADHLLDQLTQQMSIHELQLAYTKLNTTELEKQQKLREGEKNIQEQLESQLGLVGKIAKTLSHFRGIADDVNKALSDTTQEMQRMATEEGKIVGKWQSFGMLMGSLGKNLSSHFSDPLVTITSIFKLLKSVDGSAGEFAKSMNVTYSEALNVRGEMQSIAFQSGDVALNSERLQTTLMAVGKEMGSNAKLNEADLITFTKLREQAGLTNEELMGIQKLSLVNGKTLANNTKEILGAASAYNGKNKLALNEKQILKDVNSASAALKLSLGGSASQLSIAAAKAREFGLNLQQTEKIAESLLNFESSIESELSAELLTGRDLNLEQARLLALNGQTAEAAAEIAKQVGTSADFTNMNVIQQEAIAKAAGMTRNELADSLIDRESLAKLGVKEATTAQEAYNKLKERGLSEAEIIKKLGDEKLAQQYEQQNVQDRFNNTVAKLKDIFVSLAEPILQIVSPFADLVGYLASSKTILTAILSGLVAYKTFQAASLILLSIQEQKEKNILYTKIAQATAASFINPALAIAGLAAAAVVGSAIYSSMKGDDVVSHGEGTGYGNRTLLMGKDAIQLNNQDTVIAGTGLFKGNQQSTSTQDNSALIAEIRAMRNELNNRPVVVHSVVKTENNDVLASATNQSNRKTGYSIQ